MSATLTGEVDELKSVVLRNPALVKLADTSSSSAGGAGSEGKLTQYIIRTSEDEKFLLAYVILKLKLVKGKILIFVNDTDRGYRLKLFLEKFGIRSGVLNAELPFNSR
jgi:ATP-dependent RNA helicase DDX56/DBP9